MLAKSLLHCSIWCSLRKEFLHTFAVFKFRPNTTAVNGMSLELKGFVKDADSLE